MTIVLDQLKVRLAKNIAQHGQDGFMSVQLKRQIAEAEAQPKGDGLEHYHGGVIKGDSPKQ